MAQRGFLDALAFSLRWEGGYSNHAWDRGGATNFGITQRVYDTWREAEGEGRRPVKEIQEAEVEAIYRDVFWYPSRCHLLFWPVSLVHFDTAVNSGSGRATRLLQLAAGVRPDGILGPVTLKAVEVEQRDILALEYCRAREAYLRRLARLSPENYAPALKGWINRLDALRVEIRRHGEGEV